MTFIMFKLSTFNTQRFNWLNIKFYTKKNQLRFRKKNSKTLNEENLLADNMKMRDIYV